MFADGELGKLTDNTISRLETTYIFSQNNVNVRG